MLRIKYVLLFLIVVITSCQKTEIPGLIAHYPFSGDALDQSQNENHAAVFGAQLVDDRFGTAHSAYQFNGTSSYIEAMVSNMPSLESPHSISLWFMVNQPPSFVDSLGADNIIALVDSTRGIGIQLGYRASGYHTLGFDAWYWGGRSVLDSQHPQIGKWHHCVYIYDGHSHLLYLDGERVAQSTVKPQQGKPKMLMLGNYPGGDQFFEGSLDEVRIYNKVLVSSEIISLYKKKD